MSRSAPDPALHKAAGETRGSARLACGPSPHRSDVHRSPDGSCPAPSWPAIPTIFRVSGQSKWRNINAVLRFHQITGMPVGCIIVSDIPYYCERHAASHVFIWAWDTPASGSHPSRSSAPGRFMPPSRRGSLGRGNGGQDGAASVKGSATCHAGSRSSCPWASRRCLCLS